jgi:glyoxylase I family protein
MLNLKQIHHVAIICSDYETSKKFYTEILGFAIQAEHYRAGRKSWKLDLSLKGQYVVELFSFPNPPERPSRPEAVGLRHLAMAVENIKEAVKHLQNNGVATETIRMDEYTGKRFTFFEDPDGLPLELYEG